MSILIVQKSRDWEDMTTMYDAYGDTAELLAGVTKWASLRCELEEPGFLVIESNWYLVERELFVPWLQTVCEHLVSFKFNRFEACYIWPTLCAWLAMAHSIGNEFECALGEETKLRATAFGYYLLEGQEPPAPLPSLANALQALPEVLAPLSPW